MPGRVKTRLIPALGAGAAADLHQRLVLRALDTLIATDVGTVEICCAPDSTHEFFIDCQQRYGIALSEQCAGNLGTRMQDAFRRALSTASKALIVGADCPSITVGDVRGAASALNDHDAALIPAEDGGYALIGATKADPKMFDDIDWGTSTVLNAQRERFRSLGWRVFEGPTRWDVDRPEDLARLAELVPPIML